MVFLDFEKDLESLHEQLEKIRQIGEKGDLDVTAMISELEQRIATTRAQIYGNLSGWQRVQLSRHPERPYTLYYIKQIATDFIELHGDRCFGDDKALVGGIGQLDGQTVVFIGQQKGVNTKLRQYRNFGMSNPEGYRKALRLMKLAERFGFPVVSLIDTPGAFPGIEAEARGQAEAIARNLFEMAQLRTPIVSVVIGEGASGGAIGIGLSDRSYMMENTWYSVISPESCSSILWRSWDQKERAAEELHLTATDMLGFGIIDGVVAEPVGGAHAEPEAAAAALKAQIKAALAELSRLDADELVRQRIDKYDNIGVYREGDTVQYHSATPLSPEAEYAALHPTSPPRPAAKASAAGPATEAPSPEPADGTEFVEVATDFPEGDAEAFAKTPHNAAEGGGVEAFAKTGGATIVPGGLPPRPLQAVQPNLEPLLAPSLPLVKAAGKPAVLPGAATGSAAAKARRSKSL